MFKKRRDEILELLKERKEIRLTDLKELYPSVSEMTLRRDLDFLSENSLILRTHGGAKLLDRDYESSFEFARRVTSNMEAKSRIADYALNFLEPSRSIYLDAGTTLMAFAEKIPEIKLYAITNAPNIGLEIIKKNNAEVILLGGGMNKATLSVTGPFAMNCIDSLNIDIAFMGTGGFSIDSGFTNAYFPECELKKKVIKMAKKVIILMDNSKINRNLPFTFASPEDVDYIICDSDFPEELSTTLKQKGIKLISG